MPISSSVYDSSPSGKDLTFTFSTMQNGVPLSYTDVLFQFRLYDARIDLTGDVVEDTDQIIATADSGAFSDYFIFDEGEQVVAVTIPWAVINNYEEGFSGNTHGSLEAIMPPEAQSASANASSSASILFFGIDDGQYITNSKGFTGEDITRIKNSLSLNLNKAWSASNNTTNKQAGEPGSCSQPGPPRGHVILDGECLGSDGEIYDTSDHILPCYCFAPATGCHGGAAGGVTTTMWGPFAVIPAPWIIPSDPDMNLCGEKTFTVYVMLYGGTHIPCEQGVGTTTTTRYLIQSYIGSQANPSSQLSIPGWHEVPEFRQPYYQTTGVIETDAQACLPDSPSCGCQIEARIIPIAVPISVRPMDDSGSAPPVLITLDIDGGGGGRVCYSEHYCDCSCRVFQPLPLVNDIVWNVTGPGCTTAVNCGGTRCGSGGDTDGGFVPYQFSQILFKNWPNNTAPPSNIDGVLQHNSIFGPDGGPLDPPHSKYTHYTPNMPTIPWAESDYYRCGSKYHIWLRFEASAVIG